MAHQGEALPGLVWGATCRSALCTDPATAVPSPPSLLPQAIDEAGGWHSDTVVEDMDLSLRAFLADWKGLYVPHVGADNENPDDLPTYRTQQYR